MESPIHGSITRRSVLKSTGAAGILGLAGLSGSAGAKNGDTRNHTDIAAFLNKPAAFKEGPIWDGTVVDDDTIDVGAFTSVSVPDVPLPAAPVAYDPQVVRVTPGTTVTWTWLDPNFPPADPDGVPHDVVSFGTSRANPLFASELQFPGDAVDFSYTFDEPGEYLFYCTPHGAPFAVDSFLGGKVNNEFGMRGAVIVTEP
jgi:plastocyanin